MCAYEIDAHMWLSLRPQISGLSNCTWPAINYVLQGCEKGRNHSEGVSGRGPLLKVIVHSKLFLVSNSHLLTCGWSGTSGGHHCLVFLIIYRRRRKCCRWLVLLLHWCSKNVCPYNRNSASMCQLAIKNIKHKNTKLISSKQTTHAFKTTEILSWICTFTLSSPSCRWVSYLIGPVMFCLFFVKFSSPSEWVPWHNVLHSTSWPQRKQNSGRTKALNCDVLIQKKNDKERMIAYHHEVTLGLKHAGAYGFVPVVEGDHVEADGLRYCQEEWQRPNGHDLDDGKHRDTHSLDSAPGGHGPVPVMGRHRQMD